MEKNIRVLLISPLPPPIGGIASWTVRYMEWMKSNGHQVKLVNNSVIGKRAKHYNSKKNIFNELKRTINILNELKKQIKDFNPNIVHINTSCSKLGILRDYECARLAKKFNNKVIVHYHCNIQDQLGGKRNALRYLKKISNIAEVNIVLNTPSLNFLKAISRKSVKIIPNFVEEIFIKNNKFKPKQKVEKIIFVGHIKKTKGISEIIEAAKKFKDIIFMLVGPVYEKINNYSSNVKLIGVKTKNEIMNLLMDSDLFMFPSYTEGFSLSVLEAMSVGLPVIASDVGANKDMIENAGGIIIKKNSVESLINGIETMLDYETRLKCSLWNQKKVRDCYTIDNVINKIIELY